MKKYSYGFSQWAWTVLLPFILAGCIDLSTEQTPTALPTMMEQTLPPSTPTLFTTATTEHIVTATAELFSTPPVVLEGGVTVDGYTFSPPQEVPDDLGRVEIIGWLPGSPDEIVVIEGGRVIAINVYSGQVRRFSEPFEYSISPQSVRLLGSDKVAFATYDVQAQTSDDWWISSAEDKRATAPMITEAHPYSILMPDGESLIVYNVNTKQANLVGQDGAMLQTEPNLSSLLTPLTVSRNREDLNLGLLSSSSPNSHWTVVFNMEHFSLVDLNTGESKEVDLGHLWADAVYWSPDGHKLAMLVAEGGYNSFIFSKPLVLEIESGQMKEIETGYQYVTNVTWSPDSENLLITVKTGTAQAAEQGHEYKTSDLFWVDTLSNQVQLIPLLPEGTYVGLGWNLSWAPDGQKIALVATITRGNPQLYRIDVSRP